VASGLDETVAIDLTAVDPLPQGALGGSDAAFNFASAKSFQVVKEMHLRNGTAPVKGAEPATRPLSAYSLSDSCSGSSTGSPLQMKSCKDALCPSAKCSWNALGAATLSYGHLVNGTGGASARIEAQYCAGSVFVRAVEVAQAPTPLQTALHKEVWHPEAFTGVAVASAGQCWKKCTLVLAMFPSARVNKLCAMPAGVMTEKYKVPVAQQPNVCCTAQSIYAQLGRQLCGLKHEGDHGGKTWFKKCEDAIRQKKAKPGLEAAKILAPGNQSKAPAQAKAAKTAAALTKAPAATNSTVAANASTLV